LFDNVGSQRTVVFILLILSLTGVFVRWI